MACGKPKLLPEGFTLGRPCPPSAKPAGINPLTTSNWRHLLIRRGKTSAPPLVSDIRLGPVYGEASKRLATFASDRLQENTPEGQRRISWPTIEYRPTGRA